MNNCFSRKRYLVWVILVTLAFALAGCGEGKKTDANTPASGNETIADTTPPAAPTDLTATPESSSRMDLSWTAPADTDVTGYSVYRGTAKIATLTSTSYADTGLFAGTEYCYQVEAFDAAGNASNKTPKTCSSTLTIADTTPPAAPTDLTATPESSSRMDLSWTAPADTDVTGYSVYRGTAKIATLTSTSYADTGLFAGTEYCYQVEAFDAAGNTSNKTPKTCSSTLPVVVTTPATLLIRVVNNDDKSPISGATVVLGDSTGAMINYSTTDSSGEIIFTDPPANATVTAALSGDNETGTLYSLKTLYDVNISEVAINLAKVSAPLGTVSVNVTNTIGADYWEIYGGEESVIVYADNPITGNVNIVQSNIQSDGEVSFVAVGYNAGGSPIGYGTFLDQTFINGMTVNIDINKTDLSTIAFNMATIPDSALSFDGEVDMGRKGASFIAPFWDIVYAPIPSTVTTSAIPEYGDVFRHDAWINMSDSAYYFSKNSATIGNQAIDWGTFPAIPSNLAIDDAGTARPVLSWNGSGSAADYVKLWISYDNETTTSSTSSYRYFIEAPTTRTSIAFPELPETLASFRPTTWIDYFEAGNIETDMASGYDDSLVKYGQYISGTITEYVMKSSWGYYVAP